MMAALQPEGSARLAALRSEHGAVLLQLGRVDAARPLLEHSAQTLPSTLGPEHRAAREAQRRLPALERVARRTAG